MRQRLRELREMNDTRNRIWPPLLEHLTGYTEADLVPLALRYHRVAMQLLAEVARGAKITEQGGVVQDRGISPGGHQLRRQLVNKYSKL